MARSVVPSGEDELSLQLARVEQRGSLLAALDGLSHQEPEELALRFGGDLTLQEIAAAIGERMASMEGRVHRGLRTLCDDLDVDAGVQAL